MHQEQPDKDQSRRIFDVLWQWKPLVWSTAVLLIGWVGGVISAVGWIQKSAQSAVLSDQFLATLASKVRPTRVFNSDKTIDYDVGTQDYIDDIEVVPDPTIYGFKIYIRAKKLISHAPLVTCINSTLAQQSAERTTGTPYGWTVVMAPQSTVSALIDGRPMDPKMIYRFKLEILP
jgi:hypothetical protein